MRYWGIFIANNGCRSANHGRGKKRHAIWRRRLVTQQQHKTKVRAATAAHPRHPRGIVQLKIKPHHRLHVAAISLTGDEGSSSPMSFLGKER